MNEFLSMGGYGIFVWPAFALSVAVMAGLVWQSLRRLRRLERELAALEAARAPRRRRHAATSATASEIEA